MCLGIKRFIDRTVSQYRWLSFLRNVNQYSKNNNMGSLDIKYHDSCEKSTLVIMGNGPSFIKTYESYKDILRKANLMCVNNFAQTEFFKKLKPQYYVLADSAYFREDVPDSELLEARTLLDSLNNTLSWNLELLIPDNAIDSYFVQELRDNKYLTIYTYSSIFLDFGGVSECFLNEKRKKQYFELLLSGQIRIPYQTVVNQCISLGIFLKFAKIYLIGVDMSLMDCIRVDQKTNELNLEVKHLYGVDKYARKYRVSDYLTYISRMFKCFELLNDYAKYAGCSIYNASNFSYIDCYDRRTLSEIAYD